MVSQMSTGSATMLKNTSGESSITFQVSGGVYMRVHAEYLCDGHSVGYSVLLYCPYFLSPIHQSYD